MTSAGVAGGVGGLGSWPFPWGQHGHSKLGTKGPSSLQRPGWSGGGRVPADQRWSGAVPWRAISLGFMEPCPPACRPTDSVGQLQEVMLRDSLWHTGCSFLLVPQTPGPGRLWAQGRWRAGARARCALAAQSFSAPCRPQACLPSERRIPGHYICTSSGVCLKPSPSPDHSIPR